MKKVLFSTMLLPCLGYCQSTISGIVVDGLTQDPLPFANVYVNGTTKGTVTDADGHFYLTGVNIPADVVFSFVGYRPEVRTVAGSQEGMQIKLQTRNVLPEVVVMDKRLWEKDLKYFKRMFLGEDRWGRNAVIMNEENRISMQRKEISASTSGRTL